MRATLPASLLLVALATSACGGAIVNVSDGFGELFGTGLHQPYATGTAVYLTVQGGPLLPEANPGWLIASTDDGVLAIDAQIYHADLEHFEVQAHATGPGRCDLVVWEDESMASELDRRAIEVVVPDVKLVPELETRWRHGEEPADVGLGLKLLSGGSVALRALYRDGERPVYGNGLLRAEGAGSGLTVDNRSSSLSDADHVRLTASEVASAHHLTLYVGDTASRGLDVQVVERGAVQRVELMGDVDGLAFTDSQGIVAAMARDAAGSSLHGLACAWRLGDATLTNTGDYVTYEQDTAAPASTLSASCGSLVAEASVHASKAQVVDSTAVGCSAMGTVGSGWLVLGGLLLLGVRRGQR